MISHAAATDIPIAHPIIPPNRAKNIFCIVYSLNHYDSVVISARVCIGRKFLSDWGGMHNLAFIELWAGSASLAKPAQNSKLWQQ